jgi:hypothetical protein
MIASARLLIIVSFLACAACSTELRATYHFDAGTSYREVLAETSTTPERAPLIVRCSQDELPKKCLFEDENTALELELVNRAPELEIGNESGETIQVLWDEARFVMPDGSTKNVELLSSIDGVSSSDIREHGSLRTRVHFGDWEQRCEDIDGYEGPIRLGEGYVMGAYNPGRGKKTDGSPIVVAGCPSYPKGMLPDRKRRDRTDPEQDEKEEEEINAQLRRSLEAQVGRVVQLVLPIRVSGRRFDYVLAYAVQAVDIEEARVAAR